MPTLLPPFWLIRAAVAAVWFYEGRVKAQQSLRPRLAPGGAGPGSGALVWRPIEAAVYHLFHPHLLSAMRCKAEAGA
jgi:hypothetical protein